MTKVANNKYTFEGEYHTCNKIISQRKVLHLEVGDMGDFGLEQFDGSYTLDCVRIERDGKLSSYIEPIIILY